MPQNSSIEQILSIDKFRTFLKTKRSFEPFKMMGIQRKEVIHSRILAYFLNKKSDTQNPTDFFNLFIEICKGKELVYKNCPFNFYLDNADERKVYTEYSFEKLDKPNKNFNYIDVLLTFGDTVIAIENKLYAGESLEQLKRYQNYLKGRMEKNKLIIFLTISGKPPLTHIPEDTSDGVNIVLLSWIELKDLLKKVKPDCEIEEAYLKILINQLKVNYEMKSEIENECFQLFQSNPKVYRLIANNYNKSVRRHTEGIFDLILKRLKEEYKNSPIDPKLSFDEKARDNKGHFELDIRQNNWPKGVYIKIYRIYAFGIFPYINENDDHNSQRFRGKKLVFKGKDLFYFDHKNFYSDQEKDNSKKRFISENCDYITEENINEALVRFENYFNHINNSINSRSYLTQF